MSHEFTAEELAAIRSNPEHGPFNVEIDVSHHYFQEPVGAMDLLKDAVGLTPANVDMLSGKRVKRVLREFPTTVTIFFGANSVKTIQDDRAVAKAMEEHHAAAGVHYNPVQGKSFNQIVADHIKDAAMLHTSPTDHWTAIRVPGMPKLEAYLNAVFETGEE